MVNILTKEEMNGFKRRVFDAATTLFLVKEMSNDKYMIHK